MADPRSPIGVASTSRRAMSPAQAGYVQGSIASVMHTAADSTTAVATARTISLGMASSLGELIGLVPMEFRESLRPHFKTLQDNAERKSAAGAALAKLQRHHNNGTYPAPISGLHVPAFQFSKPFLEGAVLDKTPSVLFEEVVEKARRESLATAITMKKEEFDFFCRLVRPEMWYPQWCAVIKEQVVKQEALHKIPALNEQGVHTGAWEVNPVWDTVVRDLETDLIHFGQRLLILQASKEDVSQQREDAKKKLKETADVEMGDATPEKRVEDTVARVLGQRLKSLGLTVGVPDALLLSASNNSVLGKRFRSQESEILEEVHQAGQEGVVRRPGCKRRQEPGVRQQTRPVPAQIGCHETWHITEAREGWETRRRQERQRQSERELIAKLPLVRYANPLTYPDEILDLPVDLAVRYLLQCASPALVEAARFRSSVHLGPGVELPKSLSTSLSVGLRFLFSVRPLGQLIVRTYTDFCERLKWRIHFMNQAAINGATETDDRYDPDYDLHLPRKKSGPETARYITDGLNAGWTYVNNYVTRVVPSIETSRDYASSLIDWKSVEAALKENNLIVSVTDKNLGVAIITKQWFVEGALGILEDPTAYTELTQAEAEGILMETVREVCSLTEEFGRLGADEQLVKFLVSKCPLNPETGEPEGLPKTPRFYVIPKIHKKPVKHRPIIPCHSTAQGPIAKFVSKRLKPMVDHCKFVIKGTKQLAQKFAELKLDLCRKAWLVTGDVVAFYPSIPLEEAIAIIMVLYRGFYREQTEEEITLFEKCLRLANAKNVVEFQGRLWLQTGGLAMGQAPSPDIANLWGAYFEEHFFGRNREKLASLNWAFYGRYIDDCLGIVYADSAQEALQIASHLRLDDKGSNKVRLLWEVSEWTLPFLDMLIYIDPGSRQIRRSLLASSICPSVCHA